MYTANNYPWNNNLNNGWKWRLKLKPGDDIIKSLEAFAHDITNNCQAETIKDFTIGFAEFRMLGSVWADSVKYAISEEFGNVNTVAPYSDFTETEKIIAEKAQKGETLSTEELAKRKKLELLFCWGTISWESPTKPKAHGHILFGEAGKGNAFGDHLLSAEIAIVAEIIVDVLTTNKDQLGTKNWDMDKTFSIKGTRKHKGVN